MTKRQKRISRLVGHRERVLGERIEHLQATRLQAETAWARSREEEERLRHASAYEAQLLDGALQAGDWLAAHAWVQDSGMRSIKARREAQTAEVKVRVAQTGVLEARSDLKRLEVLAARISKAEHRALEVAEQKSTDEHATRRRGRSDCRGEPS